MKWINHKLKLLLNILLLSGVFKVYAQDVILEAGIQDLSFYSQSTSRNVPMKIGVTNTGDFVGYLLITVKSELDFSPTWGYPGLDRNENVFKDVTMTKTTLPNGDKQLRINFSYTSGLSGENNNTTLNHLLFPYSDLCDIKEYDVKVELWKRTNTDPNSPEYEKRDEEIKHYRILDREDGHMEVEHLQFSDYNCRDPFFHAFKVKNFYIEANTEVTYNYNADKFDFVAIYKVSNEQLYNVNYDITGPGEITIHQGLPRMETYQVYLYPKICKSANNQSFTVYAIATERPTCFRSDDFIVTNDSLEDLICCPPNGEHGDPVPFIANNYNQSCAGVCGQTLYVIVNNFTNVSHNDFIYKANFPAGSMIKTIELPNTSTPIITVNSTSSGDIIIPAINAMSSYTFKINYVVTTLPPANQNYIDVDQTLGKTSAPSFYDTKVARIKFSDPATSECNPILSAIEYAKEEGGPGVPTNSLKKLTNGDPKYFDAYLVLKRGNVFPINNLDFKYTMNDYLKVDMTTPPQYYYGPNPNSNFNHTFSTSIANVQGLDPLQSNEKRLIFKGITLNDACPADFQLIIKVRLISLSELEVGTKSNPMNYVSTQSISFAYSNVSWEASGRDGWRYYVAPSCDGLNFVEKSEPLEVTSGVPFYYSYVIDNYSATRLSNPIMVGSLPHVGDVFIKTSLPPNPTSAQIQRGSQFTLPCPISYDVVLQKSSGPPVALAPSEYELVFASDLNKICATELQGTTCTPNQTTAQPDCNGAAIFFRLKLNPQNLNPLIHGLPAFTKLVLRLKVDVPAGTPIGMEALGSFAGSYSQFIQESTNYETSARNGRVKVANNSPCIPEPPCECENSFAPIPGKSYVLSAWVKEDKVQAVKYEEATITLVFKGRVSSQNSSINEIKATGDIIDGWQRIEQVFTVPSTAVKIGIKLNNGGTGEVFFDDIRIHPFDANMKSFVYDPKTLRLSAELDERNYATFYEYNEEGALVRVKKETAKGVMTIKESRNASKKIKE